jgi:hypothetical protein
MDAVLQEMEVVQKKSLNCSRTGSPQVEERVSLYAGEVAL